MSHLVMNKQLREAVQKLELLDYKKLQGYRELRLAHVQLSFISNGYIWQDGDSGVTKVCYYHRKLSFLFSVRAFSISQCKATKLPFNKIMGVSAAMFFKLPVLCFNTQFHS